MPDYFVADQTQLSWVYESGSYLSGSGNNYWPGMVQEHSVDESMGVINSRYLGTASQDVGQFIDGQITLAGTLRLFPQDWKWLYFAFGRAVDGGSPSPYSHTITAHNSNQRSMEIANQPLPSFQMWDMKSMGTTGSAHNRFFLGCLVDTLRLSATENNPLELEMTYLAGSVSFGSGAQPSVTADTSRPFIWSDCKFHLPSGTTVNELKSFEFNINRNLIQPNYVDAKRAPGVPIPVNRDYEVTVTTNATATWGKVFYDQYFVGGSTFNALFEAVASTGSRELFLAMSGCKMSSMTEPSANEGIHEFTLTFNQQTANAIAADTTQYWTAWSGAY